MTKINYLLDDVALPKVARFVQKLDDTRLEDVGGALFKNLERLNPDIKPGMRIAITGGSRGIDKYQLLMKTVVDYVKHRGAQPFIVPAMGSHGGGIAEKQTELLDHLGISEATVGAPIVSSMEVVQLGLTDKGLPVYIDKNACEADGVILLNRVKCHTGTRGPHESGLVKMMAIGLAKHKGAEFTHRLRMDHMAENIVAVGRVVSQHINIVCGVASIENGYGEVADVFALSKEEIWEQEPEILLRSKKMMPRIFLDSMEALIVKNIGKEISGACMDSNIINRYSYKGISGEPDILSLGILNLTDKSDGNAIGMGLADYMTTRIRDVLKFEEIYVNAITALVSRNAMMPMALDTDKLVFQVCIKTSGRLATEDNRLVIIRDTKHLNEIYMSRAAAESLVPGAPVTQVSDFEEIPFDENGTLQYFNNYID